ncbi:MAG: DNA-3-methyladenine glycosylase family protein [Christensenellales bacterium]|jgi:N-glycosylase/DNA lyase
MKMETWGSGLDMDYQDIVWEGDVCIVKGVRHFHPARIFECGQCFRFEEVDGVYQIVAYRRRLFLERRGRDVAAYPCTPEDFEQIWKDYFDLGRSYEQLCAGLAEDERLKEGICYGEGLRILRQQPFETLVSFIISANNNIGRIRGIVGRLCERYGDLLEDDYGTYYAFPEPWQLAAVTQEDYREIGAGYRAVYLAKTVEQVVGGKDLERIRSLNYAEAKRELLAFPGVGPKVSDCILLFAYGFGRAFPVDVWVRRSMQAYLGGDATEDEIRQYAFRRFREVAGLAQQYLFFYERARKRKKGGA